MRERMEEKAFVNSNMSEPFFKCTSRTLYNDFMAEIPKLNDGDPKALQWQLYKTRDWMYNNMWEMPRQLMRIPLLHLPSTTKVFLQVFSLSQVFTLPQVIWLWAGLSLCWNTNNLIKWWYTATLMHPEGLWLPQVKLLPQAIQADSASPLLCLLFSSFLPLHMSNSLHFFFRKLVRFHKLVLHEYQQPKDWVQQNIHNERRRINTFSWPHVLTLIKPQFSTKTLCNDN